MIKLINCLNIFIVTFFYWFMDFLRQVLQLLTIHQQLNLQFKQGNDLIITCYESFEYIVDRLSSRVKIGHVNKPIWYTVFPNYYQHVLGKHY